MKFFFEWQRLLKRFLSLSLCCILMLLVLLWSGCACWPCSIIWVNHSVKLASDLGFGLLSFTSLNYWGSLNLLLINQRLLGLHCHCTILLIRAGGWAWLTIGSEDIGGFVLFTILVERLLLGCRGLGTRGRGLFYLTFFKGGSLSEIWWKAHIVLCELRTWVGWFVFSRIRGVIVCPIGEISRWYHM